MDEILARQAGGLPFDQLESAHVPEPVIHLVKLMLAIDPSDRPQSARDLLTAIDRCGKSDAEARREEGFWVAVLPFKFSGDGTNIAVLADGLNEEIVTGLSRFPYLRVLARGSTARFTGESFDVRRAGFELGARYLVEGSLRQAGNRLRFAVQLLDTQSAAHLWAETFERDLQTQDIFALQDELTDRVIANVADVYGVLARAIATMVGHKPPEVLTPYEAVWRFFLFQQRGGPEDHLAARVALEHAIQVQPGNADAWAALAIVCVDEDRHAFNPQPFPLDRALRAAERAMGANSASQMAHFAMAVTQYFRGDTGAFRVAAERALSLNPLCSYTLACISRLICYSGDWERGLPLAARAIELCLHHPGWYYFTFFLNEFRQRRYPEALAVLRKLHMPDYWVAHVLAAITHARLGNTAAAREAAQRIRQLWPEFEQIFGREHLQKWLHNQPELIEDLIEGVQLAGFSLRAEAP